MASKGSKSALDEAVPIPERPQTSSNPPDRAAGQGAKKPARTDTGTVMRLSTDELMVLAPRQASATPRQPSGLPACIKAMPACQRSAFMTTAAGAIPAKGQQPGDQGPRRGPQQPVALLVLLSHRADQIGELVPLALGVLSGPVELLHRLAHQRVAGLGNRLLMLLGRQPERGCVSMPASR
jgi:hypothetical protein